MEILIPVLVLLVIACLVYWAGSTLIAAFGLPAPVSAVFTVIFVVVVVLAILNLFGLTGRFALR